MPWTKILVIDRKWHEGVVRGTYILKCKEAAMHNQQKRPFSIKEMACAKALRQKWGPPAPGTKTRIINWPAPYVYVMGGSWKSR